MKLGAVWSLLLAALLVAGPASAGTTTPTPTRPPGPAPTGPVGISDADRQWLVTAHQAHLAAIAAGNDAARHAVNAAVDDFGQDLVRDHTELDRIVTALAGKYDVTLPQGMTDAQRSALYDLLGRPAESYDGAWVRWQLRQHREARAAAAAESSRGTAADVAAAARDAGPVLLRHEQELGRLADDLGVRTPSAVTGGTGGQAAAAASRTLPVTLLALLGAGLLGADQVLRRRRSRAGG